MNDIISSLNWRYATKVFDSNKKLSAEQLDVLIESARLSPSSYGIEPWKLVVVSSPETRSKLREAAYGQPSITDAPHLFVLTAKTNLDEKFVDDFIRRVSDIREIPADKLSGLAQMIKGSLLAKSENERIDWATRQVYIMLGVILSAAAVNEIDACPIEGFVPQKFDEILGLKEKGLESKVVIALGFRSETDQFSTQKKVRQSKEELVLEV